jgi:2-dehydropantoate 2-reductase
VTVRSNARVKNSTLLQRCGPRVTVGELELCRSFFKEVDVMRIAIMGSGGVGAYVGARLQAAGEDVTFIARGAHLKALQQDGLRIEAPADALHLPAVKATDDPAGAGTADLVVFAVKLWDTETAARQMRPMVGAGTRVVTLQNGIDSVALITRALEGVGQVRGGVIYLSAVIDRPGVIRTPGGFRRILVDAANGDPVVAAFVDACNRSSALEAAASDDIATVIWEKFAGLASFAGATALLRATMGEIMGHPETRIFLKQLMEEVVAVSRAVGTPLRAELPDELLAKVGAMPPSFRASMAEDLERGKPLELQWLSGRVHGLGQQYGVPTPAHTAVFRALILYENGAPRRG